MRAREAWRSLTNTVGFRIVVGLPILECFLTGGDIGPAYSWRTA